MDLDEKFPNMVEYSLLLKNFTKKASIVSCYMIMCKTCHKEDYTSHLREQKKPSTSAIALLVLWLKKAFPDFFPHV